MKCAACGFTKQREPENFQFKFVNVDGLNNLHEGLSDMVKWDQLDGYKCDKCANRGTTSKREIPNYLSDSLFICLKRFHWDWSTGERIKINSRFDFPQILNMKPYVHVDTEIKDERAYFEFELSGVIVHMGGPSSGHYYSFAKSEEDDEWVELNDSKTSSFDSDNIKTECFGGSRMVQEYSAVMGRTITREVSNTSNAFMLVYKRIRPLNSLKEAKMSKDCIQVLREIHADNAKLENANRIVSMSTYNAIVSLLSKQTLQYKKTKSLHSAQFELYKMCTKFLLRVVCRTLIGRAVIVSMIKALCNAYAEIADLRRWFLVEQCVDSENLLLKALCTCPDSGIRSEISKFLSCVLESEVVGMDEKTTSFASPEDKENNQGEDNKTKIEERPLQYFLSTFLCSQSTMELVAKNWKCLKSFFSVLKRFAETGSVARRLLCVTTRTIMWTVDMFMGRRSPLNLTLFSEPKSRLRPKIGSRWDLPDWSEAFDMLQILIRCCRANLDVKEAAPTSLDELNIPLDKHSKRCLVNRTFFVEALKCPTIRPESISQIVVHFAFEWKTFSHDVVSLLIEELATLDSQDTSRYLLTIDSVVGIVDSFRYFRVAELFGQDSGLFALLRLASSSENRINFTLGCVKRILSLASKYEHMSSYMAKCYKEWSWIGPFLKNAAKLQAKENDLKRSVAMQALSIVSSNMKVYTDEYLERCAVALDSYCEVYAPGKNTLNFRDMLNRLRNANRPFDPLFQNLSSQYQTKYGAPALEIPEMVKESSVGGGGGGGEHVYGPPTRDDVMASSPKSNDVVYSESGDDEESEDEEPGTVQGGCTTEKTEEVLPAATALIEYTKLILKLKLDDHVFDPSELD